MDDELDPSFPVGELPRRILDAGPTSVLTGGYAHLGRGQRLEITALRWARLSAAGGASPNSGPSP